MDIPIREYSTDVSGLMVRPLENKSIKRKINIIRELFITNGYTDILFIKINNIHKKIYFFYFVEIA
jgi:hypothetical protein